MEVPDQSILIEMTNSESFGESQRNHETSSSTSTTTEEEVERRIALLELYKAAMKGDWKAAEKIFAGKYGNYAKTARLNGEGMTALHVAANCGKSQFVENLVRNILSLEELKVTDQVGRNALHHVALASNVRAAKAIIEKDPSLANAKEVFKFTPLFYAARWRDQFESHEMLQYLITVTNDVDVYTNRETAPSLIVAITGSQCYDVALKILGNHRELAVAANFSGWSILYILATQPSAFPSGNNTSLWKRNIYPLINFVPETQKDALKLLHLVCRELRKKSNSAVMDYFLPPDLPGILHLATRNGVFELVEVCLNYFPDLIWYSSDTGKLLIHVAVKQRRIEIFNHIMQLIGENAGAYAGTTVGEEKDNILHLAAYLSPLSQLHSTPGPAFQMQRELEWFKAVEILVYREEIVTKNSNGLTPPQLFFDKHNDLIKDAKEWIKDTSNSCMVVAALVATVAFASMITVPGGSDSGTGLPVLSKKEVFVVFSVSNALSMITSAIALLMFLSLQTSRFTTEDFLATLPKNLVRGLLSLFFAVATMMIAFGTAIGMVLQTRVKWAYIPITIVACIPAIIFTKLQLPLLFQTFGVISGPRIFTKPRHQKKRWCLNKFCYHLLPGEREA